MNRDILDEKVRFEFSKICENFGLKNIYTLDQKIGSTNFTENGHHIFKFSLSQIITTGVQKNRFEINILGSCSIKNVETFWIEYKPLVSPKMLVKDLSENEPLHYPATYNFSYSLERVLDKFPSNVNGKWLSFEISESGIAEFKEVANFIIENDYTDQIKNPLSIEKLDSDVNSTIEIGKLENYLIHKDGFIYRRMIIAKLNKNQLFDEICDYHRSAFPQYLEIAKQPGNEFLKNIPEVFEKVYAKLRGL
ncbi:MAG: hypothetical protein MK078_18015 [Crocinitomicaceae bacterium]|nr:hypothetical protein [Crocinitomicaceae bacterium]MCH2236133.1 hypothetical protein [Crocinitomicaceae bacterium]